jgi:hypothetical protein
MGGMPTRSDLRAADQPYPILTPRSTWERFNMAKTDSGWPLLIANLLIGVAATSVFTGFLRGCPGLRAGEESVSCGAGQG